VPQRYTLADRDKDNEYVFRVQALNALGAGAWSEDLSVAAAGVAIPEMPEGLAVVAGSVTARSFSVSWGMPPANETDGQFYRLQVVSDTGAGQHRRGVAFCRHPRGRSQGPRYVRRRRRRRARRDRP